MNAALKQRVVNRVVSQFGRPRGTVGHAVGWIMASRDSNRGRNEWVVETLDIQPTDRVLEIGFGPGIAVREAARRAVNGKVYGIDHSLVMLRQATKRNRAAISSGVVDLRVGSADALPDFGEPLDKVLTVNCLFFWTDPVDRLRDVRSRLRPGGVIAVGHQPRCPGATAETSREAAQEITEQLTEAGFVEPRVETLDLDPPAVCVLARAGGRL